MSAPERVSMLVGVLRPGRRGNVDGDAVVLAERRPAIVQVSAFRGQEAAFAATLASETGLAVPAPGRATTAGDLTALWVQPSSFLVLSPWRGEGELYRRLSRARASTAAVVEQTGGKCVLRLSGRHARQVLAKGCRVDLHQRAFGPGRVSATPIAGVTTILHQVDAAPTFDLIVPSTLSESFGEWLMESGAEFGVEIAPSGEQDAVAR